MPRAPRLRPATALAVALALALPTVRIPAQGPPPRPAPTGKPPPKSPLQKTGDTTYELGGLRFDSATREIRVPCAVNMSEGVIEYALVTDTGKTHESLLKTKAKPFDLQIALLLCHYEPHAGELISILSNPQPEQKALAAKAMDRSGANLVKLSLEWKDKDGRPQAGALEDWIHDKRGKQSLRVPHWIFNGSDTGDGAFSAHLEGSLISIHFDLAAILGNPAKWSGSDDNWEVETSRVPPVDAPVTLVISPARPPKAQP